MNVSLFFLIVLFFFTSCYTRENRSNDIAEGRASNTYSQIPLKYARGFSIDTTGKLKVLKVFDPWQKAKKIELTYYLLDRYIKRPDSIKELQIIRTPVKRIICLSTTHIALLDFIDETRSIVGISGKDLVNNNKVVTKIQREEIVDVGYESSMNYELVVSLKPDIVMAYGVGAETNGYFNKLEELGVKIVFNAEYLENNPLGKAEWAFFVASFYNKLEIAIQKFKNIEKEYTIIKESLLGVNNRPSVFCNIPWKDMWYIPGGDSYFTRLIEDAGGNYIGNDNTLRESIPVSFEAIYTKARKCNYWVNTSNAKSLNEILSVDERLKNFEAFKNQNVYNNNAILNQHGGNDYWESGIVAPHIILKDLASIFHPELYKSHKLFYYRRLE